MRAISSKLGKWIAHMHQTGQRDESVQTWKENGTADKVFALEEAGVRNLLAAHQVPMSTVERALATFQQPAGGLQTGVIFDFRLMNVLLSRLDEREPSIAVIDLEASTYGDLALDLQLSLAKSLNLEAQTQRKSLVPPS